MRVNTYSKGGYTEGGFTSGGGTMTGPLILAADPVKDLEAATKQYADAKLLSFDASKFISGTLQVGRLPAFTGDVTSSTGSNSISLANIGITPGVYTKVTVNAKGLVTAGFSLVENDLPALDWSKIIAGSRPTTLAGYGITDGLAKSGGTLSGTLTLVGDPTATNQAATKQYVDSNASNFSALKTGDIIRKMTSVTPTGFLKCNGGQLSKTAYAALYAVVGDAFNVTEYAQSGAGQPWRQQYQSNTTLNTDITGWSTDTSIPNTIGWSQAIVTKNRVYLLGGCTSSGSPVANVYTAPINADGSLGTWTTGTSLPGALAYSQAIVTKNRVYLLGGSDSNNGFATVYTAPINTDGTLGTWAVGTSLPTGFGFSQAIITKNRVYLLGGAVGTNDALSSVYTAPINTDGTLGTWSLDTPLLIGLSQSQAVITKNRVYLLGGSLSGNSPSTNVYTAPINADGTLGTWTTGTSLPGASSWVQVVVTSGRVYLMGGGAGVQTVYTAPINLDGTLGAWVNGTPLPGVLTRSQTVVLKNTIYTLGGATSTTTATSTVYKATITGGLNDYSPYYDGTVTSVDPANFKLPDLTASDLSGSYSYIKL